MTIEEYLDLKRRVIQAGYESEVEWAAGLQPCDNALAYYQEYAWVVINSGMRAQVAQLIWGRINEARRAGRTATSAFGHKYKAWAIDRMWELRDEEFALYQAAPDKLAHLQALPWIGPITKYHLARNLGLDACKPDRHLVRIARGYDETPEEMCARLSGWTGERIGAVDCVIWRAANLGFV